MGETGLKTWQSYRIDIDEYFRAIYNRSCPESAKIAIMGDTDNMKVSTLANLDYIRIGKD